MEAPFAQLVHAVQRERGISTGFAARAGSGAGQGAGKGAPALLVDTASMFTQAKLNSARATTDNACRACGREPPAPGSGIAVLRNMVDCVSAARDEGPAACVGLFYSVFKGYTTEVKKLLNLCSATGNRDIVWAFAQLKEATGFERALLTGVLNLDNASLEYLPSNVWSDFVVCVHQQRTMAVLLQRMKMSETVLKMITAALTPPPELMKLRARLEATFNVREARGLVSPDRWWAMITQQIDKMEEAMVALGMMSTSASPQAVEAIQLLIGGAVGTASSREAVDRVISMVEETDPDALKTELLRALKTHADSLGPAHEQLSNDLPTIGMYELSFEGKIGDGGSGAAYKATMRGMDVAVKVAKGEAGTDRWRREMNALARLRHVNIVQCFGVVSQPPVQCLVLEHAARGDLRVVLDSADPLPQGFVVRTLKGIGEGMAYLHREGFVHRDLKSSNILLNAEYHPKLTDFGVSSEVSSRKEMTAETGTYRWMAPEVTQHQPYSFSADVYSFAMVMFELLTRNVPFQDRTAILAAVSAIKGERPPVPPGTPAKYFELMHSCWHQDQLMRPDFSRIIDVVRVMESNLGPQDCAFFDTHGGHPVYSNAENKRTCSAEPPAPLVEMLGDPFEPKAPSIKALRDLRSELFEEEFGCGNFDVVSMIDDAVPSTSDGSIIAI